MEVDAHSRAHPPLSLSGKTAGGVKVGQELEPERIGVWPWVKQVCLGGKENAGSVERGCLDAGVPPG